MTAEKKIIESNGEVGDNKAKIDKVKTAVSEVKFKVIVKSIFYHDFFSDLLGKRNFTKTSFSSQFGSVCAKPGFSQMQTCFFNNLRVATSQTEQLFSIARVKLLTSSPSGKSFKLKKGYVFVMAVLICWFYDYQG